MDARRLLFRVGWAHGAIVALTWLSCGLARGTVVGPNSVVVRTLGAVEPRPTIDEVRVVSSAAKALKWDANPGENVFHTELSGK